MFIGRLPVNMEINSTFMAVTFDDASLLAIGNIDVG